MSEKNQYIEKAKARIAQWDAEIDKMKAKANHSWPATTGVRIDVRCPACDVPRTSLELSVDQLKEVCRPKHRMVQYLNKLRLLSAQVL